MAEEKSKIVDLDEGFEEFFTFRIKGYNYNFRQPTTDELEVISKLETEKDFKKQRESFYTFITPASEESPSFPEIAGKLTLKHWLRFFDMVKSNLGLEDGTN